jgi:hypothetical protein
MFHCSASENKQKACVWLHFQAFFSSSKRLQSQSKAARIEHQMHTFGCLAAVPAHHQHHHSEGVKAIFGKA